MPITQEQINSAQAQQHAAAHDPKPQVRLIAGPGSGKSFTIQERVYWLLSRGVPATRIFLISFTRASTQDLMNRVRDYCVAKNQPSVSEVSISTLHSLALRALRTANLLAYPTNPLVMDDWELEKIFDAEFSIASRRSSRGENGYAPSRCELIRRDYEAFCGTGQWNPVNYIPPDPPISELEREEYRGFHVPRTQAYSCVIPGEIVRKCVEHMNAGGLNVARLLNVDHLIVDEYQDLNPMDLEFIDGIIANGVNTFVAGDDDQSIYSFRFASPQGIQSFTTRFSQASHNELTDCFRSTPEILKTAQMLITGFSEPERIRKNLQSLYENADPAENGIVHRWQFASATREAKAIASSCRILIDRGIPAREIMILLSNTRAQLSAIVSELASCEIEYESPKEESFFDSDEGRMVLALLRVVCDPNDYVAHRLILGLRPGVGERTCNAIAQTVIVNNLNYRQIFHNPLPEGLFSGRSLTALSRARDLCVRISNWQEADTIATRGGELIQIIQEVCGQNASEMWGAHISHLPQDIALKELCDYLIASADEQQASLLKAVYERLNLDVPSEGLLPMKVRIMTMHGAKGLSARVVFIPGLNEDILPGTRRRPYPGLVNEAARMLYVSITRARAACVMSYARTNVVHGQFANQPASRFTTRLAGTFTDRSDGLSESEAEQVVQVCSNL